MEDLRNIILKIPASAWQTAQVSSLDKIDEDPKFLVSRSRSIKEELVGGGDSKK